MLILALFVVKEGSNVTTVIALSLADCLEYASLSLCMCKKTSDTDVFFVCRVGICGEFRECKAWNV